MFHSFIYNQQDGSFIQADKDSSFSLPGVPPDNCPVCAKKAADDTMYSPQLIQQGTGIAFGGYNYHLNDFALVRSDGGLCLIGQIVKIEASSKARDAGACQLSLTLCGRVRDMLELSPSDIFSDEASSFHCSDSYY